MRPRLRRTFLGSEVEAFPLELPRLAGRQGNPSNGLWPVRAPFPFRLIAARRVKLPRPFPLSRTHGLSLDPPLRSLKHNKAAGGDPAALSM
jgi:hypothetical protein